MKAMKKVLALALALAMVVTAVPVTSAEAATLTAGKSKKITYYVGKTNTVKLSGVTASKVKSTTWSKNGSTAVNLKSKAKTSVKVQVVKAGTAKVTASVKLKSGKTKKYTLNITTKNPTITAASAATVAVGDKVSVKATGVKPASATVEYSVADSAVATVDAKTGDVTGVKAGKTTVTAKLTCGTTVKEVTTDVTVKNYVLKDATQTAYNAITVTVGGTTADLKVADFKITNTTTHATIPVQSVSVDKNDASKVYLSCFASMTDAKEYVVELDGTSVTFTATDNKVNSIQLSRATVPAGKETPVNLQTIDVNGVVLANIDLNGGTDSVTSELKITNGYVSASKVYLPTVGNTMTVKATYHTYKYDTTGNEEGTVTKELTITAVDPTAATYGYALTIAASAPAWDANSFKANNTIKVDGNTANAYIRITDTSVDPAVDLGTYTGYTVESSDKTKLLVAAGALANSNTAVVIQGVSAGTAYIIVKKDNAVVASLPVTILAKPVATKLELDKSSANLVASSSISSTIKATLKDQYGDKMTGATTAAIELLSKPNGSTVLNPPVVNVVNSAEVTVAADDGDFDTNGAYTFKLTLTNDNVSLSRTVTFNRVATGTASYVLEANDVDTTIYAGDSTDKNVVIRVAEMMNGGVNDYVSALSSCVVKNAKGETVVAVDNTGAISGSVSGAASYNSGVVTITAADYDGTDTYTKPLAAGTYTVAVEYVVNGNTNKSQKTFTVTDTQDTKVSYKFLTDTFAGTVKAAFADPTKVEVYYDGILQTSVTNVVVYGTPLANGGAFVTTVTCTVKLSGSNTYVPVTITVNDQVKSCTALN